MRKCVECGILEKDWNFENWKFLWLVEEGKNKGKGKRKRIEMRRYFHCLGN